MHGVQLTANSTPSSGAPIRPARGRIEGRTIRPVIGKRSNTPANSSPSRIVTAAQHLGHPGLVALQHQPQAAEGQALGGEHEGEADHEQHGAEQGPAPGSAREARGPRAARSAGAAGAAVPPAGPAGRPLSRATLVPSGATATRSAVAASARCASVPDMPVT